MELTGAIQIQVTRAEDGGYVISAAYLAGAPALHVAKSKNEMLDIVSDLFEPRTKIPDTFHQAIFDALNFEHEVECDCEQCIEALLTESEEGDDDDDTPPHLSNWFLF